MNRTGIAALFTVSILVACFGSFFAGSILAGIGDTVDVTAAPEAIVAAAKQAIGSLQLPPRPEGRYTTELVQVEKVVQVPKTRLRRVQLDIPGGFFRKKYIEVPETYSEPEVVIVGEEQQVFVDATPEKQAAWEAARQAAQDDYDRRMNAEIVRLTQERQMEERRQMADLFKSVVVDIIVPLLAALAGLLGAIVGLVHAFRAPPKPAAAPAAGN